MAIVFTSISLQSSDSSAVIKTFLSVWDGTKPKGKIKWESNKGNNKT